MFNLLIEGPKMNIDSETNWEYLIVANGILSGYDIPLASEMKRASKKRS
ncbi:hypothetical protein [Cohnella sp. WQ 127256]|nr:hypothetical protein [Cohnella sp. WQ 127256]